MSFLPFLILIIIVYSWVKKSDCFGDFTKGAKEGVNTIVNILPSLIGLFAAITVFRASGAMDALVDLLAPAGEFLGIEAPLIPLILMRPVSGSATLAMVQDVVTTFGPDSKMGQAAAVMMGSTETVFYTLTVYLGGNGIKRIPGVVIAALGANFISSLVACWLCT